MLNKIEFGDIYKYYVSTGTILIALAFLLPYFYLKENFGIIISQKDYDNYTEVSKIIVDNKQSNILFFQDIILYVSGVIVVIGTFLLILGIFKWNKRQRKIDEKFDKELEKLSIEIVKMSPSEKEQKINTEIEEIVKEINIPSNNIETDIRTQYKNIEDTIINSYNNINQNTYEVFSNIKVNKTEYDLLLKSKSIKNIDQIIEIKFYKNRIIPKLVIDSLKQFDYRIQYYSTNIRKAKGVFYIVYDDNNIEQDKVVNINFDNLDLINNIKIQFLRLSDLDSFKVTI